MARGIKYDEHLLVEYARRHSAAHNDRERGDTVRWFMDQTGASYGTAYRVLQKIESGIPYTDVAAARQTRKSRKSDIDRAKELRHAKVIAAIKQIPGEDRSKWIPTEHALRIAGHMGLLPEGIYTRSTMDRLLAAYRLNRRSAQKQKIAHELTAKYPTRVFVVDATPMDQYYLSLDGRVVRYDAPEGDKHLDDILARERLSKIWVYYLVDMYSKAFLPMPFASLPIGEDVRNSGENAEDWLSFLKFCFLPKRNMPSPLDDRRAPLAGCPIEGVPEILYSDKGSGIGRSTRVNRFCLRLGIQVVTHKPGNPSAKGMVEGRISAFKRSFESQLIPKTIKDINQLIYFYQIWADHWNRERGYYDTWQRGVMLHPIRRADEQNLRDANVSHINRVIDGYGCVSIDREHWFVTWDEQYRGTRATVYRPPSYDGEVRYIAELYDGTIIECTNGRPEHDFEEIKSHPKSRGEKNREEVRILSKQIGGMMSFEDTLPPESDGKIVRLPSPAVSVETHSPVVPERFDSAKSAWRWILNQTGLFAEEISEENRNALDKIISLSLEEHGSIPGDLAVMLANLINKNKRQEVISEN